MTLQPSHPGVVNLTFSVLTVGRVFGFFFFLIAFKVVF